MIEIIKNAKDLCLNKEPFVMASIIFKHGSAPRVVGATMLVTKEGRFSGHIGGEQEFDAIDHAKELLKLKKSDKNSYEVSKEIAAENGMVCGGKTTVYFQYIDVYNKKNLEYFEKLISEIDDHDVFLIYDVKDEKEDKGIAIQIEEDLYPFSGESSSKNPSQAEFFKIKIKKPMRVFIFGGGVMAKAAVFVLSFLGLDITIIDDRSDFIDDKEFDIAERKILDFEKLDSLKIDKSDYVLVMTRGHRHDIEVLESVLKKSPYYVGVVGNTIKAKNYKDHFLNTDLEDEYLKKVHIPVGMKISALTPEEIAISIAGEIIESYRSNK